MPDIVSPLGVPDPEDTQNLFLQLLSDYLNSAELDLAIFLRCAIYEAGFKFVPMSEIPSNFVILAVTSFISFALHGPKPQWLSAGSAVKVMTFIQELNNMLVNNALKEQGRQN